MLHLWIPTITSHWHLLVTAIWLHSTVAMVSVRESLEGAGVYIVLLLCLIADKHQVSYITYIPCMKIHYSVTGMTAKSNE